MYLSIIVLLFGIYLAYKRFTKNFDYFEKIGLRYTKPFSKMSRLMFNKDALGEMIIQFNDQFRDDKVVGVFHLTQPVYFVRDPELIKKIAINDFHNFQNHQKVLDAKEDPLLGNILTMMNGQKWKDMRTTLSPIFTGSKLRLMLELVNDCSIQVTNHFLKKYESEKSLDLDMKDLFSRYATDVIASCSFGIQIDSFTHPNNEFYQMGKSVLTFLRKFTSLIKLFILRLMPWVATRLKLRLLDESVTKFFESLIFDTMQIREKKHIVRPDMINLMMQIRKEDSLDASHTDSISAQSLKATWTNDEVLAQCLMFFLAGFETSSTLLTCISVELALNDNIQTKLYDEIKEISDKATDSKISYELLTSMKYLDMIVSEALRKWPPALLLDRVCTTEYTLEFDDKKININEGQVIWIPVFGLHMNHEYFPDPLKFVPERFSDENKYDIKHGTYIPFGLGQRSCLGSRFALMQVKSMLFYLLKEFKFEISNKTKLPIQIGSLKRTGIYLELKKRFC